MQEVWQRRPQIGYGQKLYCSREIWTDCFCVWRRRESWEEATPRNARAAWQVDKAMSAPNATDDDDILQQI